MAQTSVLSSIQRSGTFPITQNISAPNNCGTLALILNQNWTEQMIHELPTINVAVYVDTDIKLLSIDIDMTTVCSDKTDLEPIKPYSIPLFDLPESFDFVVTPIFDNNALASHNAQIDSGDVNVFNTSDTGIVDTNITDYSSEYWTTRTDSFDIDIVFDDTKITSGGGSGGGGGQTITVDTQVIQGSTNPVQNGAIYDFVNSSVSTSTAYFIGTFNSLAELEAYSGTVTNNDYAFVISSDSNGNTVYNRYKYNGETETWNFEYALNNSSFTAAEWETIQSGLTANDRTNYNNHLTNTNNPHSVTKTQVGLGNVDNTSDANKPISTATQTALNGKQDNLTFDGTYDASTNKAATVSTVTNAINDLDVSSVGGSGKYISAISETNGKISATPTTFDTSLSSSSTDNNAPTSKTVFDDQQRQDALEAEDRAALAEVIDGGAAGTKNLLDCSLQSIKAVTQNPSYGFSWNGNVCTSTRGVSFTINADNSITVAATNMQNDVWFKLTDFMYFAGSYVISGCPTNGSTSSYYIESDALNYRDIGNGVSFTINSTTTDSIYIVVKSGQTFEKTFYPMLCRKTLYDVNPDYEPYAPAKTNVEITPALIEQVDNGAKNFVQLGFTSTPGSSSVPATTNNNDGTITVNGSRVGGATILVQDLITAKTSSVNTRYTLPAGNYVIAPTGNVNIGLQVYKHDGTTLVSLGNARSEALSFTYSDTDKVRYPYICIRLFCEGNSTINNFTFMPMICTAADWNVSQKFVPYRLSYQQISDAVLNKTPVVYGFHVNPNESDPSAAVTYLLDAVGMAPAKMGSSTFSYGSWKNAFFIPKPCMLKSDGTVDYYLNPNDYTKKSDGTASDVANASYDGNAMMEWPKIWFKYVPGGVDGEWEFYVSNQNVDGTYKCWCNINAAGQEIDHFYTAIYNGTGTTKLRSISGVQLTTANGADNTTRQQEIDRALANNTGTNVMWYTEVWSDRLLINALLYLIGKSLDLQSTFGQGMTSGSQTAKQNYYTGGKLDSNSTFNLNNKGLFWGDITNTTNPVKVFGMENIWGCVYRSCAGLVAVDNELKVKLTYDVQDGSTAHGYNFTGNGYLSFGTSASSGYITKMKADSDKGYIASSAGGTGAGASTYYCDYYSVNTSGTRYALLGGASVYGTHCGFSVDLNPVVSYASWTVSAALSCKPQS